MYIRYVTQMIFNLVEYCSCQARDSIFQDLPGYSSARINFPNELKQLMSPSFRAKVTMVPGLSQCGPWSQLINTMSRHTYYFTILCVFYNLFSVLLVCLFSSPIVKANSASHMEITFIHAHSVLSITILSAPSRVAQMLYQAFFWNTSCVKKQQRFSFEGHMHTYKVT